jgi:hypothetical protein
VSICFRGFERGGNDFQARIEGAGRERDEHIIKPVKSMRAEARSTPACLSTRSVVASPNTVKIFATSHPCRCRHNPRRCTSSVTRFINLAVRFDNDHTRDAVGPEFLVGDGHCGQQIRTSTWPLKRWIWSVFIIR